jgi:hypothetical protein
MLIGITYRGPNSEAGRKATCMKLSHHLNHCYSSWIIYLLVGVTATEHEYVGKVGSDVSDLLRLYSYGRSTVE